MADYLRIARAALADMIAVPEPKERTVDAATSAESPETDPGPESPEGFTAAISELARAEPLEPLLKHRAIELSSGTSGRLFLVSDEEDAWAMARFGVRRGEIYTAAEMRRIIIAVRDPVVAAEIHQWKRKFDGVVRV